MHISLLSRNIFMTIVQFRSVLLCNLRAFSVVHTETRRLGCHSWWHVVFNFFSSRHTQHFICVYQKSTVTNVGYFGEHLWPNYFSPSLCKKIFMTVQMTLVMRCTEYMLSSEKHKLACQKPLLYSCTVGLLLWKLRFVQTFQLGVLNCLNFCCGNCKSWE